MLVGLSAAATPRMHKVLTFVRLRVACLEASGVGTSRLCRRGLANLRCGIFSCSLWLVAMMWVWGSRNVLEGVLRGGIVLLGRVLTPLVMAALLLGAGWTLEGALNCEFEV